MQTYKILLVGYCHKQSAMGHLNLLLLSPGLPGVEEIFLIKQIFFLSGKTWSRNKQDCDRSRCQIPGIRSYENADASATLRQHLNGGNRVGNGEREFKATTMSQNVLLTISFQVNCYLLFHFFFLTAKIEKLQNSETS